MAALDRYTATDLASKARAAENASMLTYEKSRTADLASKARASENQSMTDLYGWGKLVKEVVDAGPGWTAVRLNDGTVERRVGNRASRNNNPGNVEYRPRARRFGAVGTDGRFAVFPDRAAGIAAQVDILKSNAKKGKTIKEAISSYAPPFENNTNAYARSVANAIGLSEDTPMSDLTPSQLSAMASAMHKVEGTAPHRTTVTSQGTNYGTPPTSGGLPSQVAVPASRPSNFETKYLMEEREWDRAQRPVASTPRVVEDTPSNAAPRVQGAPGGLYVGALPTQQPLARARPAMPSSTQQTQSETAPVGSPSQPAAPIDAPLTLGQKVMAGGIDVLGGLIPGAGTAVSVVNGGLALAGQDTIGERIVKHITRNAGTGTVGTEISYGSDKTGAGTKRKRPGSETPAAPVSFEEKYLAFVDTVSRPTPAERWGRDISV